MADGADGAEGAVAYVGAVVAAAVGAWKLGVGYGGWWVWLDGCTNVLG